eukprot:7916591-Pyramimonas_sp.AAC.1
MRDSSKITLAKAPAYAAVCIAVVGTAFGGSPFMGPRSVSGVGWGGDACGRGGPPHGATKRVSGVPKWSGAGMRTSPLGHSVEL